MQKRIWLGLVFLAAVFQGAFAQDTNFSSDKELSYAIGVLLAKSIQDSGITVEYKSFSEGLKNALDGKAKITEETAFELVQTAMESVMSKQKEENLKKSSQFLTENGKKKGILTTRSGLQYEVIDKGAGAHPKKDSIVVVHYVGSLIDGTVFDSSREREEPATIPLEQVIPGWAEGMQLMRVGGRAKFFIPPQLAYGEATSVEEIPPNSVLVFDVELLEIEGE
ncbi:MAG: FKBP-type peptidyl-prolyl cis-trans isomerase [Spirochaetaceae bacterium]|jgi:FKBP-type peptidyl-prolyl cis-trans isomerase|nr:FKBP-type peptidyl-prolyl cis-trans isomerase [Spirochaetaceae bacterium]